MVLTLDISTHNFVDSVSSHNHCVLLYYQCVPNPIIISAQPQQNQALPHFVESELREVKPRTRGTNTMPCLMYLISGSTGDRMSLMRTLKALYHPWNQYTVHLDLEASVAERMELVRWVAEERVFQEVGNVRVVVRSNLVTYRGPTMVSNTLHAAAILLRDVGDWDWFINLSTSNYPLLTQDGPQSRPNL